MFSGISYIVVWCLFELVKIFVCDIIFILIDLLIDKCEMHSGRVNIGHDFSYNFFFFFLQTLLTIHFPHCILVGYCAKSLINSFSIDLTDKYEMHSGSLLGMILLTNS